MERDRNKEDNLRKIEEGFPHRIPIKIQPFQGCCQSRDYKRNGLGKSIAEADQPKHFPPDRDQGQVAEGTGICGDASKESNPMATGQLSLVADNITPPPNTFPPFLLLVLTTATCSRHDIACCYALFCTLISHNEASLVTSP